MLIHRRSRSITIALLLIGLAGLAAGQDRRVAQYVVTLEAPPVAGLLPKTPAGAKAAGPEGRRMAAASITPLAERVTASQEPVRVALEAEGVEIQGSVQTVLNAVFIRATPEQAARLRNISGIARVTRSRRFRRLTNAANAIIRAPEARAALGGDGQAGAGFRIGVVDSGLDETHPALQDDSLVIPEGFPRGRPSEIPYTNNKIIAARSYVPLLGSDDPVFSRPDDKTPRDRIGHGTAVAVAAAGRSVDSPAGRLVGVAPKAFLGNYKIFGSPDINEFASDAAIIAAFDDAVNDGMDILTVSFGSVAQFPWDAQGDACFADNGVLCDPVAQAAQNAIEAFNVVIAAAAGNNGASGEQQFPAQSSIHTPATAPGVIAVGATLNSRQLVQSVRFGGSTVNALSGTGPELTAELAAPAIDAGQRGDATACSPFADNAFAGAIAVVERGDCHPEFKASFVANAGAVGMALINTDVDFPEIVAGLETTDIPTYTVGSSDGERLRTWTRNNPNLRVTFNPALAQLSGYEIKQIAPFSSRGPSPGNLLKPEIVAPGTFLYSGAQTLDSNGDGYSPTRFESYDGTSFSAPLVAGAAALVWQANPTFSAMDVRSALINTASLDVTEDGFQAPVTSAGAGRLDVASALDPIASLEPATISFGAVGRATFPVRETLRVQNTTGRFAAYTVRVVPTRESTAARVTVNGSNSVTFNLAAGQFADLDVALVGTRPAVGQYEGFLEISRDIGGLELLAPYYFVVGSGTPYNSFILTGSGLVATAGEPFPELLIFKVVDRQGQPVPDLAVTFEPAAGDGTVFQADPRTDSFGVAAADVDAGPEPGFADFIATAGSLEIPFFNEARWKPLIDAIVNGAGFRETPLAPGALVSIFGDTLAEFQGSARRLPLPVALKHVSVSFDFPEQGISVPGRLLFTSHGQANLQIPWELAGLNFALVKVRIEDSASEPFNLLLNDYAPSVFDFQLGGATRAVATHADGRLITPNDPASPGETIVVYGTGFGPVDVAQQTGVAAGSSPVARVLVAPRAFVGGREASVLFAGLTPGFVGLYQVNLTLPADLPPGDQTLSFTANGAASNEVALAVR